MKTVENRIGENRLRNLARLSVTAILLVALGGCVTEGPAPRFSKTDSVKAVEKYTELGLRYVQQGDTVRAKKPLKRAMEIAPRNPDVHNAFAILFQAEQELELADEYYLKALKLGPKETRIRNNYAAFLFSQKRYEEACQQLERAAQDELYERRSSVYENLGLCYARLDRSEDSLAAFERAIAINDVQARALLEAAIIKFDAGDLKSSDNYHTRYQRLVRFRAAPNTAKNLWLGVKLAQASGDKNKEASYALQLRNMFPDSPENKAMQ